MLIDRQDSYNEEGRDQSRFSVRVLVSILFLLLLVLLVLYVWKSGLLEDVRT